jgi:predicted O-methyltransferase YrrM
MQSFIFQSVKEIRNNLKGKEWRISNQIPYLKFREIEIFKEILKKLQPGSILEWGAGFSTIQFPALLDFPFKWLAIEHNEEWFVRLKNMNQNPNVEIILKKYNQTPLSDEDADESYEEFKDYIEAPDNGIKYDFIIIDGRARSGCLIKALKIINEGGIILLHDANRKRYHKYIEKFKYQAIFLDYRHSAGGIWIGSDSRELSEIINIKKHQKRWSLVRNKTAKILSI